MTAEIEIILSAKKCQTHWHRETPFFKCHQPHYRTLLCLLKYVDLAYSQNSTFSIISYFAQYATNFLNIQMVCFVEDCSEVHLLTCLRTHLVVYCTFTAFATNIGPYPGKQPWNSYTTTITQYLPSHYGSCFTKSTNQKDESSMLLHCSITLHGYSFRNAEFSTSMAFDFGARLQTKLSSIGVLKIQTNSSIDVYLRICTQTRQTAHSLSLAKVPCTQNQIAVTDRYENTSPIIIILHTDNSPWVNTSTGNTCVLVKSYFKLDSHL